MRLTKADVRLIWDKTGGRCHFCGIQTDFLNRGGHGELSTYWEVDHVHTVARGGVDDISNYMCICRRCNMSKKTTGIGLRRLLLLSRIAKAEYYKGSSAGRKTGHLRIEQLADNWYRREIYNLKGKHGTDANLRVAAKALRQERDQYIFGMDALEQKAIKQRSLEMCH